MGVIAQDHNGQVLETMRIKRKIRGDAFIDESLAFLLAVNFCIEASFTNVIFEGDTQLVVKEVQDASHNWTTSSLLIQDAKVVLKSLPC